MLNLVTGASLPDEGEVRVFGEDVGRVRWRRLAGVARLVWDRQRACSVIEGATLTQNLALPFALDIDPVPPETIARVDALADECEIGRATCRCAPESPPAVRIRVHLARAIALGPRLLLMEHPTAALEGNDGAAFGATVARVCDGRTLTMIAVTQDLPFASAAAARHADVAGSHRRCGRPAPMVARALTRNVQG